MVGKFGGQTWWDGRGGWVGRGGCGGLLVMVNRGHLLSPGPPLQASLAAGKRRELPLYPTRTL